MVQLQSLLYDLLLMPLVLKCWLLFAAYVNVVCACYENCVMVGSAKVKLHAVMLWYYITCYINVWVCILLYYCINILTLNVSIIPSMRGILITFLIIYFVLECQMNPGVCLDFHSSAYLNVSVYLSLFVCLSVCLSVTDL